MMNDLHTVGLNVSDAFLDGVCSHEKTFRVRGQIGVYSPPFLTYSRRYRPPGRARVFFIA